MNFFQQLQSLQLVGSLKIAVTSTSADQMAVTILLENNKCGDEARKLIPPMSFSGSPAEIDEAFFSRLGQPLRATSKLMVDMETYMKALESAKKQSAIGKASTSATPIKPVATVDPKKKAYAEAMKKVADLRDQKKYADALKALPKDKEYADKKDMIAARRSWFLDQISGTSAMFPVPYPEDTEGDNPQPEEELAFTAPASQPEEEVAQEVAA